MMRDVLIKSEWFDKIQNAPAEVQKELCYRIIRLGVFEEDIEYDDDDWAIADSWNNLRGHLVRMRDAHDANIMNGKNNGRKMTGDPQLIYDYFQANPKAKPAEIGEALGLPRKEAAKGPYAYIYDNPGWKNRKIPNWKFESGKNIPISENSSEKIIPKKNSESENSSENLNTFGFNF